MTKLLVVISFIFCTQVADCQVQDTSAVHLKKVIDIETLLKKRSLSEHQIKTVDTFYVGSEDSVTVIDTTKIKTLYYYSLNQIDQIVRTTSFKEWRTITSVHYLDLKPIKYSEKKWFQDTLKDDFEIYYFNDEAIYQTQKKGIGKPYAPAFLRFSYQYLNN